MLSESDVVVRKLAEAFDAVGIPYMVGGSIASSTYGVPRLTQDVDFVARIDTQTDIARFIALLSAEFYVDGDLIRAANVIYMATMTKADIFLPEETVWRQEEWRRRRREMVGQGEDAIIAFFKSPEDTVLQKLLWYRMTGERSDRQWGDVQGVLKVQGVALDQEYMQRWATEIGVADLLTQALDDAGLKDDR